MKGGGLSPPRHRDSRISWVPYFSFAGWDACWAGRGTRVVFSRQPLNCCQASSHWHIFRFSVISISIHLLVFSLLAAKHTQQQHNIVWCSSVGFVAVRSLPIFFSKLDLLLADNFLPNNQVSLRSWIPFRSPASRLALGVCFIC